MLYLCFLIENYLDSLASIFTLIWFYFYSLILAWRTSGFDTYISAPLVFQFQLEQLYRISLLPPNLSKSLSHYLFWLSLQNFICPQEFKQILVKLVVTIWDFSFSSKFQSEFYHNRVFEYHHNLSFWVKLQFELLSFITIWVLKFYHNLNSWVSSQFEFLRFFTIWYLKFYHNLSFWVSSQLCF